VRFLTETMHTELKTPGLWRRMACWLYEGMLLIGVVFAAGLVFSVLSDTRHALQSPNLLFGFVVVIVGIYCTWFWTRGQTLAMKTWHIRVVDSHGHPLSQVRALRRYAWSWIWFLPPLVMYPIFQLRLSELSVIAAGWVIVWALLSRFHPQGQFWHDAVAGTQLVTSQPTTVKSLDL
jgi:uncharacterized RDD family membrane protein YckC